MSLSLEVKKFINSEHSGEYVEIALPVELSVKAEAKKKPAKAEKKAEIITNRLPAGPGGAVGRIVEQLEVG